MLDIERWRADLDRAAALRSPDDETRFYAACDAVTGAEGPAAVEALVAAVRKEEDYGLYEALFNALWRFPPDVLGATLAPLLPAWFRRMARAPHQVERFLGPVFGVGAAARPALVAGLRALPDAERAAVVRAFERWAREVPEAEGLADEVRGRPKRKPAAAPEPPVPAEWPPAWKAQLEALRRGEPAANVWYHGTTEEADVVVALLGQPVGAGVRHLEALTNPLYIAYAKKHWPHFVARVAALDEATRATVLTQLTKGSSRGKRNDRGAILRDAIAALAAPAPAAAAAAPPPAPAQEAPPGDPDGFTPFVGVGAYRFGITPEACAAALGPPESVKTIRAMDQVIERRGPIEAVFQDGRLVELNCRRGAALKVDGLDVFADKGAAEALRARHPDATEQRAYLNFPSLGVCLAGFGKRRIGEGPFALVYAREVALSVTFLGKV